MSSRASCATCSDSDVSEDDFDEVSSPPYKPPQVSATSNAAIILLRPPSLQHASLETNFSHSSSAASVIQQNFQKVVCNTRIALPSCQTTLLELDDEWRTTQLRKSADVFSPHASLLTRPVCAAEEDRRQARLSKGSTC